jgi:hypothetical protein
MRRIKKLPGARHSGWLGWAASPEEQAGREKEWGEERVGEMHL